LVGRPFLPQHPARRRSLKMLAFNPTAVPYGELSEVSVWDPRLPSVGRELAGTLSLGSFSPPREIISESRERLP